MSSTSSSIIAKSRTRPVGSLSELPSSINNFPNSSSTDQFYYPNSTNETLAANLLVLGLRVGPSTIDGAGLGVFAKRSFAAGSIVGYMWGKFIDQDNWTSIRTKYIDVTFQPGEEDFVTPVKRGIWCCISVDQQVNGADHLLASRQCPMAYINHTTDVQVRNVAIDSCGLGSLPAENTHRYFPVRAVKTLSIGDELLSEYNWNSSDWDEVNRRMRRAAQTFNSIREHSIIMPLMEGAPLYGESLHAQRRNIIKFIQDNKTELDKFRYKSELVPGCTFRPLFSDLRASTAIPGLMGVFLEQPFAAAKENTFAMNYPGFLLPSYLLDKFNELYHCPTAVRLEVLDYFDAAAGKLVKVDLLGDPIAHGPNINDGSKSNLQTNCELQSVKPDLVHHVMSRKKSHVQVSSQIVQVSILSGVTLSRNDELLLTYGGVNFWRHIGNAEEYCAICFCKSYTPSNPLIQCEGNKNSCLTSRHLLCFPSSSKLMTLYSNDFHFFCAEHINKAKIGEYRSISPTGRRTQTDFETPPQPFRPCDSSSSSAVPNVGRRYNTFETPPQPFGLCDSSSSSAAPNVGRRYDTFETPPQLFSHTLSAFGHTSELRPSSPLRPFSILNQLTASTASSGLSSSGPSVVAVGVASSIANGHNVLKSNHTEASSLYLPNDYDLTIQSCANSDALQSSSDEEQQEKVGNFDFERGEDECRQLVSSGSESELHSEFSGGPDNDSSESNSDSSGGRNLKSRQRVQTTPLLSQASFSAATLESLKTAVPCPTLSVRTESQARSLEHFDTNHVPLTLVQQSAVATMLATKIGKWFAPNAISLKKLQPPLARSASHTITNQSSSVSVSHNDAESQAGEGSKSAYHGNRWRDPDAIAFDWAEYQSCCGSKTSVAPLLAALLPEVASNHSSNSILKMFECRIKWRSFQSTRIEFASSVQDLLSLSIGNEVLFEGGKICVSCFRAVLGFGRTSMFNYKQNLTPDALTNLTAKGHSRTDTRTKLFTTLLDNLMNFINSLGETPPNPKGTDEKVTEKVLPFVGEKEWRETFNEYMIDEHPHDFDPKLHVASRSMLRRLKRYIASQYNIKISVTKSKQMCRCNDCELIDSKINGTKDPAEKRLFRAQKKSHLFIAKEQREFFDLMKTKALLNPTDLWCITFDGMDQAKTKLPSRKRYAKDLEKLPRLGVHIVGAFCFGAPNRVLGIMNYPDVRKDSALSCSILERILDTQWIAIEDKIKLDFSTSGAQSSPGDAWPKRIHVTFDNAPSEAKNQYIFRYLGLLVLHGVFEAVTVSTMLVGHTHDIVDQMFSVWAKMLRITNCATWTMMRNLFRDKYHSRVRSLILMMRGSAAEKEAGFDADAAEALDDARAELGGEDWSSIAADKLEAFAREMQLETGVAPVIILQTFSVNTHRWLKHARQQSKLYGDSLHPRRQAHDELHGIATPHVFGIERDEEGDVWLYNRYLAQSTKSSTNGEQHHFPKQLTGPYSTRSRLWYSSDADATVSGSDPHRMLPMVVETAILRDTFNSFRSAGALTIPEYAELEETLQSFESDLRQATQNCPECWRLINEIAEIGVVSNKKDATAEEKEASRKKTNKRSSAWTQLRRHEKDPDFYEQHETLLVKGWFTKWMTRVQLYIRPSFVKRGLMLAPEHVGASYHVHPSALVTGTGEKAVNPSLARVDLSWLASFGEPKVGQLVVLRTDNEREPFWIGEIVATATLEEFIMWTEKQARDKCNAGDEDDDEDMGTSAPQTPASSSDIASRKRARASVAANVAPPTSSSKRRRQTAVNYAEQEGEDDMDLDDELHEQNRPDHESNHEESDGNQGSDDSFADSCSDGIGVEYDHDSDVADEYLSIPAAASGRNVSTRRAGLSNQPTQSTPAAAAASSTLSHQTHSLEPFCTSFGPAAAGVTFGKTHRSDKLRSTMRLENLPYYKIHWYDFTEASASKLHINNNRFWKQLFQQHHYNGVIAASSSNYTITPELSPAAAASSDSSRKFQPIPGWLVDMYTGVKFAKKVYNSKKSVPPAVCSAVSFILWGKSNDILTGTGMVSKKMFDRIRLDLTEEEPQPRSKLNQPKGPRQQSAAKSCSNKKGSQAQKHGNAPRRKKKK